MYLVFIREWLVWALAYFEVETTLSAPLGFDMTIELVVGMLGLSGLRTLEKLNGRSK